MPCSDEEFEELKGRQFAVEAMLTQLIWAWAKDQPLPPVALAGLLRPIERQMARMASRSPEDMAIQVARLTVRDIAEELGRTVEKEALRRTGGKGPVQ